MSLPPGVTDADIDRATWDEELPCRWEKMSGVCMVCGAGPDDACEVEMERARIAKRAEIAPLDPIGVAPDGNIRILFGQWGGGEAMKMILIAAVALAWGAASFEAGWRLAHTERPATFDERFGDWPRPSPFGSGPIRQYA